MMEFVLSRVWAIIAGLVVMAAIMTSFAGLNGSIERGMDHEGASALSSMVSDLQRSGATADLKVEMREMMRGHGPWTFERWGVHAGGAVTFHDLVTLIEGGREVGTMEVGPGDALMVRSVSGEVQLEKISTM
jgi:hypothetical protein